MSCLRVFPDEEVARSPDVTETAEEAPFAYHFLWYFLQLIFSVPGVMIASLPFWAVLLKLGLNEGHQQAKFAGYEALVFLYVGVLVGWWMAHRAPLLTGSGCWIWVVPTSIILLDVVRGQLHPAPVPWLSSYLFASSELGIGVAFFTFPACSAAGYSIGMALWRFNRTWAKTSSLTFFQPIVMISSPAVAVFCLLAAALHNFEIRSLARFGKIQSVIDAGLQLLPEPQSLCGPQTSFRTAHILPSGTYVESLGRVGCDRNRLIDPDTLPPPIVGRSGPYTLEHVRVLTGPSAGQEGWVMQYGVMELLNR